MRIAIIGAGIAGIASAIRLATQGHEVSVFEANDYPGGKLSQFSLGAFRFDAGPSLFTMPSYVEELFELAAVKTSDYFTYEKLDIICHYFWEDGTQLKAYAEAQDFAQEVEEVLGVPKEKTLYALAQSRKKYELTGNTFLHHSLHKWDTWLSKDVLKAMVHMPTMTKALTRSMHQDNENMLSHPKLVQLFDRFATYNGSNPYKAPGMLNIIPHFEHNIGAFFPKNGMYDITESLVSLAKKLRVKFNFTTPVEEIIIENSKVTGIQLKGEKRYFDKIVSNMDVFPTYKKLLPHQAQPNKTLHQERSTSALIFYWGIQHSFKQLGLHNILFSQDYYREFKKLAQGEIDQDPTVYIHISSKLSKKDAPKGGENWFVMINVPANTGQDWDQLIAEARKNIIQKINRMLKVDIEKYITEESYLDPRLIESKTSSYQGALYGTSSNNRMAAFLRHPNFSNNIKNLYFCGGSVHPGGGIPLCLLSAKIVSELIQNN